MDDIEKLINKYPPSHKLDEPTWGKDAIREMIAEAKAGQHETIVMYAIFKGDDLLEHTIRRTARECWEYFEGFKKRDKNLLQRDEKEYGFKCKRIEVST